MVLGRRRRRRRRRVASPWHALKEALSWNLILRFLRPPLQLDACMCKQVSMFFEGLCNMIAECVSEQHVVAAPPSSVRLLIY